MQTRDGKTIEVPSWSIGLEHDANPGWLTVHYKNYRVQVGYCSSFHTLEELQEGLEAAYVAHLKVREELNRVARTMLLNAKKAGVLAEAPKVPKGVSKRLRAPTAIKLPKKNKKKKLPPLVTTTYSLFQELKDAFTW